VILGIVPLTKPNSKLPTAGKIGVRVAVEPVRTGDYQLDHGAIRHSPRAGASIENFLFPIRRICVESKDIPIAVRPLCASRATTCQPHGYASCRDNCSNESQESGAVLGFDHVVPSSHWTGWQPLIERLIRLTASSLVSAFRRRRIYLQGWRGLADRLRPELGEDRPQRADARREGVTVALHDIVKLFGESGGFFV
jgi:hypothetical protein